MLGHFPIAGAPIAARGGPSVQPIALAGVASTAAYGSPALTTGAVAIVASGWSSTAYGSPTIVPGAVGITLPGLASSSAYGSPAITVGAVDIAMTGLAPGAAYGALVITTGAVNIALTGLATTRGLGVPTVLPPHSYITLPGLATGAGLGSPAIGVGAVNIALAAIAGTSPMGSPALAYVIQVQSLGPGVVPGAPAVAGDSTLSYNTAYQPRRAFSSISTVMDVPRARPFKNSETEILHFGSVVAWKHNSGAGAVRELTAKPTASNIYDLAGVVAGAGMEGTNVAASDYGQLYIGGMCQVRVLGHASLTAGSVLEAVAGQYYLQYVSSPTQGNQFVIHEDHTSVGTEALKMVNVKIAL